MSQVTAPIVAPPSRSGGAASFVLPLYTLTLFLSAFLLFAVQPMFTKMVLPLLGGSAAVWNTAVVFFQGTLLLGYFYAHLSTRLLGPLAQAVLHGVVLLSGFVFLPIGVAAWAPPAEGMQIPWLIGLLAVSIGLPFFAISATAPLLQKWFAHTDHAAAQDPYFLYGGSNLGSLAALLLYPVLIEPVLGLRAQGSGWMAGYAALALFIGACGVTLVRRYRPTAALEGTDAGPSLVRVVDGKLRLRWLTLSVVPSALLLGVTLHLGTDVAAMPFLWVLPLALYLLTFVLVFARRPLFSRKWMLRAQVLFVALVAVLYQTPELYQLIGLHLGVLFFTAMVCHGELARLRPSAAHLTEFYLWMSIGGVVGGILTAIVAPLVFDGVYEYPLALGLALLLRPHAPKPATTSGRLLRRVLDLALPALLWLVLAQGWWHALVDRLPGILSPEAFDGTPEAQSALELRNLVVALPIALVLCFLASRPVRFALAFLATLSVLVPDVLGKPENSLTRRRSFFGVYSVNEFATPYGRFHFLQNGTTNHGGQNLDRPQAPGTYYVREGPVGQFFEMLKGRQKPAERIGVIGLGVGALAPYLTHGQRMTFFEIDPLDEEIARDERYFTYLENGGDSVDVVIGDGRLTLAQEPDGAFDVLIVDAFSSDAIPVHLVTREALALYFRKLSERGLLMVHVTNAYLDLMPIVGNLASDAGLSARFSRGVIPTQTISATPSDWVVVGRTPLDVARFGNIRPAWPALEPDPGYPVWTDDSSNVLRILHWKSVDAVGP